MSSPNSRSLFIQAAREAADSVAIISDHPLVMHITFPNGAKLITCGSKPNINSLSVFRTLKNKMLADQLYRSADLPVPESTQITLEMENDSLLNGQKAIGLFATKVGFPIYLKPNRGSQGKNVFCLSDASAAEDISKQLAETQPGRYMLQEACFGDEYRIVFVKGKILLAYLRQPLFIVGDGHTSIRDLISRAITQLAARGRKINLTVDDDKITNHLSQQKLTRESVLPAGQIITIISNKNLSDGCEPIECTEEIRKRHADICQTLFDKCGIVYGGLDLIEDQRQGKIQPRIIEVNGDPGFIQFTRSHPLNPALILDVYKKILCAASEMTAIADQPLKTSKLNGSHVSLSA